MGPDPPGHQVPGAERPPVPSRGQGLGPLSLLKIPSKVIVTRASNIYLALTGC